ncbi:MAG: hypothetical protein CMM46_15830 [Rhodospirillaceae bacterium]|nr:hypothetical protein [Rhodospirillaceae bacterium]|tara:strand:- start:4615 stop:5124 length:510 start_codon:yes stop_codon:yes gene_type:complete
MIGPLTHRLLLILVVAGMTLWNALPASAESEATVLAIQESLNAMGFAPGTADGVMGSNTIRAIEAFQKEFGLPVTGEASDELLDRINAETDGGATSPERLLARANLLRSYTRAVQMGLLELGYDPGPVDGAVGPMTRSAIVSYQAAAGLPETGEVSKPLLVSINTSLAR